MVILISSLTFFLTICYISQKQLYGWEIVNRYRAAALERFSREFFSRSNNFGAPLPVRKKGRRTEELPTFWEFIQYVKDTG